MKKTFLTVALTGLLALSASAQGRFAFANIGTGFSNPITDKNGALCVGSAFSADFIYQVGSLSQSAFDAGTPIVYPTAKNFSTITAGKINGGNIDLAGLGGATITMQVRAWANETINGTVVNSYALASTTPGAQFKTSNLFTIVLGDALASPPGVYTPMSGMNSFQLTAVPEPSTIALGVMGLSALLFRRRK